MHIIQKAFDLEAGEYTIRIKFKSGDTNFRNVVIGQAISLDYEELKEGALNNKELIVKLSGASFNANLTKENWSLDLPDGLDFKLERVNDSTVKIILTGEAIQDFDTDLKRIIKCRCKRI